MDYGGFFSVPRIPAVVGVGFPFFSCLRVGGGPLTAEPVRTAPDRTSVLGDRQVTEVTAAVLAPQPRRTPPLPPKPGLFLLLFFSLQRPLSCLATSSRYSYIFT